MDLMKSAEALEDYLIEIRREIHRNPELSGEEKETAALVCRELEKTGGYAIRTNVCGYGVIAELKGGRPGPITALRADMDALPVKEETGLSFSSERPGKMHACGHDLHTAMLIGAARLLKERQDKIKGTVRLIFQPAEEDPALKGSEGMIESGALDGVSAIFGMHCWPELAAGTFGIRPGEMMASSEHFAVKITGKSAHGAQPHAGHDALFAGCQFVQAVQSVVSRNTDPFDTAVVTIGEFHSGVKYNVLAQDCVMDGTIRTYSTEVHSMVRQRIRGILQGICEAFGCTGEYSVVSSHPAVINDEKLTEYCLAMSDRLFGEQNTILLKRPTSISEDFSRYAQKVPAAFGFLGITPPGEKVWPLHSCHLSPDESVMTKGAAMYCAFVPGAADD